MNRKTGALVNMQRGVVYFSAVFMFALSGGCAQADGQDFGVVKITAADSKLHIDCAAPDTACKVLELESFETYQRDRTYPVIWKGTGRSTITLDRYDGEKDRVFRKFLLVEADSGEPIGNARYVTTFNIDNRTDSVLYRPKQKKGISCVVHIEDVIELGVKHVHENIYLDRIIALNGSGQTLRYEGVDVPVDMDYIRKLDERLIAFTEAEISVVGVFLNRKSGRYRDNPLVHPDSALDATPTGILAFNVDNEKSSLYYRAALELLADRYTRPDKKYGQLASLVVGNEVQQHWIWYNMGEKPEDEVLDNYHRAVRLAWLAAQKHHHDLRIYISMEHHWTQRNNPLREIQGNVLLEKMAQLSRQYGDFPWHLAFHPYPENLFEPRAWRDRRVTDDFSTPKLTFKNIEVLPRFMKQPHMLYRGQMRDIAITEQGFHTPEGPDGEKIQAAAYAYAFYKVTQIPEISLYIMHRHVDHLGEGGLLLGVWTADPSSNREDEPLRKKYIWDVFKHAETPQWEEYFAFAKPIIGIENWGDTPTDKGPELRSAFDVLDDDIIFNFVEKFSEARQHNNMDSTTRDVLRAAGWMAPGIYQHPPQEGVGEIVYTVPVPPLREGRSIKLVFESYIAAASSDGVKASIEVDGKPLFSTVQTAGLPRPHNLDLSEFAGQTVNIRFVVDCNGDILNDWYYWINPLLIYE